MTASVRSRRSELLDLLVADDPQAPLVQRLCDVSARLLGVSGAGMCLVGVAPGQMIVHGTDPLVSELEDLQLVLGQGPCIQAVRGLRDRPPPAWQTYAERALARGVRALFAFPVMAGPIQFGALDLYRLQAGALDARQIADALVLADIASVFLVAMTRRVHADGNVSALHWLTAGRRYLMAAGSWGSAVDLGITVEEAFAR